MSIHATEHTPAQEEYRLRFITDENGRIKPKLANNFYWMLRGHPATVGMFVMRDTTVRLMRRPPWDTGIDDWKPRALNSSDIFWARVFLENQGLTPSKSQTRDAINAVAESASL